MRTKMLSATARVYTRLRTTLFSLTRAVDADITLPPGHMPLVLVGRVVSTLSQRQEIRLHQGVAVDEICTRGGSARRQPGAKPLLRGISCAPRGLTHNPLVPAPRPRTASTPGQPRWVIRVCARPPPRLRHH